jgi:hypothetical protein
MVAARITETIVDDGGRASGVVVDDGVPMAETTVDARDAARSVVESAAMKSAMERAGVKPAAMESTMEPAAMAAPPCPRAKARFGWLSAATHSTAAAALPKALPIMGRALFSLDVAWTTPFEPIALWASETGPDAALRLTRCSAICCCSPIPPSYFL